VRPGNADFPIVQREVAIYEETSLRYVRSDFEPVLDVDLTLANIAEEQAALTAFEHDFYDRLSARRHRLDMLKIDLKVGEPIYKAPARDQRYIIGADIADSDEVQP